MDSRELEQLKARVARAFSASHSGDIEALIADCRRVIPGSELFSTPAVHRTGSQAHQIEVRCQLISPDTSPAKAAAELERVWEEELRYRYFAAHAITTTPSSIMLDFLTVAHEPRLYLTGMIIVDVSDHHPAGESVRA